MCLIFFFFFTLNIVILNKNDTLNIVIMAMDITIFRVYNILTRSNNLYLTRPVIGGVEFRKQRLQASENLQGENPISAAFRYIQCLGRGIKATAEFPYKYNI